MQVKHLMQIQPIAIEPEATLYQAAQRLLGYGVNGLPVVGENDRVIGMISLMDVLRAPFPALMNTGVSGMDSEPLVGRRLKMIRVDQVMARDVIGVPDNEEVEEVVGLIIKSGIHPLPVFHGERLVGVFSRSNALNAILNFRVEPKIP